MKTLPRVAVAAWLMLAVWACGDEFESEEDTCPGDDSVPCYADPWNCEAGQACWFSAANNTMECLNQGMGQLGDTCSPTPGNPPCAEGLMCLRISGEPSGTCRAFCLGSAACKACPSGQQCMAIDLSAAGIDGVTNVCLQ